MEGRIDDALEILEKIRVTKFRLNVQAYNILICTLCEQHRVHLAIRIWLIWLERDASPIKLLMLQLFKV